jgi:hypothetical protein
MHRSRIDRRKFLGGTALVAVGALAIPARAWALRVEENEAAERLYLSACETRLAHDEIVRDLIAQLEGQEGRDRAAEIVASMACPLCGCPLSGPVGPALD